MFFGAAQSALTSHAESMGFVDIQVNIGVVFLQRHQAGQVAFVTVHAEYAFGHDEYRFVLRGRLGNQPFQLFVIVMPVAYAAGFGESYPVDYARMDEFVGQNQRAVVGHCRQNAAVGMVAAVEYERGSGFVQFGESFFQSSVHGEIAGQ